MAHGIQDWPQSRLSTALRVGSGADFYDVAYALHVPLTVSTVEILPMFVVVQHL